MQNRTYFFIVLILCIPTDALAFKEHPWALPRGVAFLDSQDFLWQLFIYLTFTCDTHMHNDCAPKIIVVPFTSLDKELFSLSL